MVAKKLTVLDVMGRGGLMGRKLPGYEERPQQVQAAQMIERCLRNREHAVLELPTGAGKSFTGLVPAVLSGEKVLYSTAVKSLQDQIKDKDGPFMADLLSEALGRRISVAVMKGRGNYVCLRNVDDLEQNGAFRSQMAAAAFDDLSTWIGQQRAESGVADIETYPTMLPADLRMDVVTSTDECTGQKCRFFRDCFAERAKERAANADIVVANHKLTLLDGVVRASSEGHASILPDYSVLLADEVHNLESIARDTLGVEVTPGRMSRLGWMMQKLTINYKDADWEKAQVWAERQEGILHQIALYLDILKARLAENDDARERALGDEMDTVIGTVSRMVVGEDGVVTQQDVTMTIRMVLEDMFKLGNDMEQGIPSWLDSEGCDLWGKLANQTIKLAADITTILQPGEENTWIRRASLDGEGKKVRVVLDAKPINVAPQMRKMFFGNGVKKERTAKTDANGVTRYVNPQPPLVVVGMSATISSDGSMRMFRDRIGCDRAVEMVGESPFNYRENALMYLPGRPYDLVPVQRRDREGYERYMTALANEMRGLTLDARGGAFLLFTSRSAMNEIYDRIANDLTAAGLLVMRQGDANRAQMILDFKASGRAVLFGLKTFGEGIDVQGDALRLVAVDKVPFNPPTDVVWKALCDFVDRNGGNSFRELSIPNAVIVLKQFAGRLIRTKRDRGVIALLDGRLQTKERVYGGTILRNMPPADVTDDPARIKALYAKMGICDGRAPKAQIRRMAPLRRVGDA